MRVFDVVVPVREFDAERRLELATRSLAIAQSIDALSEEAYAYLTLAMIYDSHGEIDEARRNALAGLAIAERLEHAEWLTMGHATLGWIALTVLDLEDALHEFERGYALAQASGSHHFEQILGAFYAYTLIQTGQLERAEALLYPDAPPPTMRTISGRMLWLSRADLALARGEPQAALNIVEELYASALNLSEPGDILQLAWRRAQAELALGNNQGAYDAIAAAVRRARERGFEYDVWRMHIELGRLLTIAGDTAGAEREFATGRTDLHRLAGSIADAHERAAFLVRAEQIIGRPDSFAAVG